MSDGIFDSCIRSAGDLAGVLECDDDASYFYLYDSTRDENRRVLGAICLSLGPPDFEESDIDIRWDRMEEFVAVFIRQDLRAIFEGATGCGFGGISERDSKAEIPEKLRLKFGGSM